MGIKFIDQFSLLHFSSGTIVYFWRLSFVKWFFIHMLYELLTNTKYGIYFICAFRFEFFSFVLFFKFFLFFCVFYILFHFFYIIFSFFNIFH